MALDLHAVDIYGFFRVGVLGVGATRLVLRINGAAEMPVRIVWEAVRSILAAPARGGGARYARPGGVSCG